VSGGTWADFAAGAPDMAAIAKTKFEATKHHVLATLAADGSPRVYGVEVQFHADDLTIGRFRVRSQAHASVISNATHTQVRRARAFLEVNGTRHPLQSPGLVVGRGTEADLRINDPGVSRRHVEFTVNESVSGDVRISVQDLGSTNGMLVDGHRISSTGLQNGSEVRIGRTTMTVRVEEDADV